MEHNNGCNGESTDFYPWLEVEVRPKAVAGNMQKRDYKLLQEAWGNWLHYQWEWEWFVSLTFRDDHVGTGRANVLWRMWHKQLVKETGKDVQYVRVTEFQRYRGIPHYHALILNVKHVRRLTWKDRWDTLAGYARILRFDPKKGAAYYLCKYIVKDMGEVVFSDDIQDYTRFSNRPEQLEFSK